MNISLEQKCSNTFNKECNELLLEAELLNHNNLQEHPDKFNYLYPNLNDPNFNIKIAEKKEFSDTKYDGTIYDVKAYADILSKSEFELSPHQAFVRNFMSFQTPYNSLLLFHGLGSGKTCSAIGVTEEMRDYFRQMGISKQIIIVASPNVQDNFKLQLFDERKLKQVDGIWTMKGCIGNKLLKEINPTSMKGLNREKIISQIKTLINSSYSFMGYTQFSNEISRIGEDANNSTRIKNLQDEFTNRLIVIDEVHNIRIAEDTENKNIAKNLMYLVSVVKNIRLLLLSATPMFNNYTEIIWILNLMNMNDRRGMIGIKDVFDGDGNFKKGLQGEDLGKELFIRKATGYISYVRGENPYTFPFRVYPNIFSPNSTFKNINEYPKYQLNCKLIPDETKISKTQVYLTKIGDYQQMGYSYIIDRLRNKKQDRFEKIQRFGYTDLQIPLESLNIIYPIPNLKEIASKIKPCKVSNEEDSDPIIMMKPNIGQGEIDMGEILRSGPEEQEVEEEQEQEQEEEEQEQVEGEEPDQIVDERDQVYLDVKELTGTSGLQRIMNYVDSKSPLEKGSFEYKRNIQETYGNIFSPEKIGSYSAKIKSICESIYNSKTDTVSSGIILIYSSYIDGGILPMALALEEMGFVKYGKSNKSLFKNQPTAPVDARTMKPSKNKKDFIPARYVMITGDTRLSPNNDLDVKALTNDDNINGDKIKVVLISQAGSEGLDFKAIRQIHIMEPWYNMNRIEQITGRGVRNFSHKGLPFEQRNVEIFLHGTILEIPQEEAVDLYVYRVAELKAIKIGKVTRLLKQTSVDCIINHDQNNFNFDNFKNIEENRAVTQILSTGLVIHDFEIGDVPNSANCDYMDNCEYDCLPDSEIDESKMKFDTYNETFMLINSDKIIQKIKTLMRMRFFYKKKDLFHYLNTPKKYPTAQIYAALTQMITDNTEYIVDRYGRTGYLINIGDYYLFQPSELNNNNISIYDRSVPLDFKHNMIEFKINQELNAEKPINDNFDDFNAKIRENKGKAILETMRSNYNVARTSTSVERGEENWYKHCGSVIQKMSSQGIPIDLLHDFLIEHIIESLMYDEKIELLNYLNINSNSCLQEEKMDLFIIKIKKYFCDKIMQSNRITAIILFDGPSRKDNIKIYVLRDGKWLPAEPEDIRDLGSVINAKYTLKTNLNEYVGFMGYEDKQKYMIFKVKNTMKTRHTGSRCDQAGKKKTIELLNEIVGKEEYTKENTRGVVQQELCILQEFILRNFEREKKDGKNWFLNTEMAVINEF